MQVGGLEDRGERPLAPCLRQVEEQGWHSNDDELGQVMGQLWEGTESPRARRKVAPVMLFLSQFQSLPFPEMLAVSPCYMSI